MTDKGFLARWSRRKQQARRRMPEGAAPTPTLAQSGSIPISDEVEPEISAEELARLPRTEDLTAESDLRQFLQRGVPLMLRNAALRRAWELDPKIRAHVGEARDYAYDWNTAGGVPGAGPLAETDIEGLLRQVIGDRQPESAPAVPQADARSAAERGADNLAPEHPLRDIRSVERRADPERASDPAPAPRRHGGAMPV
jgi:hypothetical protein